MRRLLLLLMLLPACLFAAWAGWPWLIFIVTGLIGFYGYVFLKDIPGGGRIAFFAASLFFLALFAAFMFYRIVQDAKPQDATNTTGAWVYDTLMGTSLLRVFWAGTCGLTWAVLVLGLVALGFTLVKLTKTTKSAEDSKTTVTVRAARRSLGLVPAQWVVREGAITTLKQAKPPYPALTGPGEVEIQLGHAVILEHNGGDRRVLPSGVYWVNPDERIAMVIPLYGRADVVTLSDVVTHDGLVIEELELTVFHKVNPGEPPTHQVDSQFPYSEDVLLNQIWSASGKDWREGVTGVTKREARNVISDLTLEEFLTLNSDGRGAFKQKLESRINDVTKKLMGIGVTLTGIGAVKLPAAASTKLTEHWTAAKDHQIEVVAAEGRRDAFNLLYGAMRDALKEQPTIRDLLVMSFIERMEHDSNEHSSDTSTEVDTLTKIYLLEALKSLSTDAPPKDSSDTP